MKLATGLTLFIFLATIQSFASTGTTTVTNDEKEVLVADTFSRTLYVFDLDVGSTTPKCSGDCADLWPPSIVEDADASSLVAPLGFVVRASKKLQLTYKGRPVYTYGFDRKIGDDKGDGIGGVWHYIEVK